MLEVLAVISVIILIFLPSIIAVIRGCKYFIFVQLLMVFSIMSTNGDFSVGLWIIALLVSLYKTQRSVTGLKGDTGPQGHVGPMGPRGDSGMSAYETWLNLGNKGTEQDFIDYLKKGE